VRLGVILRSIYLHRTASKTDTSRAQKTTYFFYVVLTMQSRYKVSWQSVIAKVGYG